MDLHYCEIPVTYKRFGIKRTRQQGFLFSNLCWYLLYDEYNFDFEVIPKVNTTELMSKMIYQAARVANWDKGLNADFTLQDVAGWLDNCPTMYTKKVEECYSKAMTVISEDLSDKAGRVKKK